MKITICGSMTHEPAMVEALKQLQGLGYDVDRPNSAEDHKFSDNLDANAKLKQGFIDEHFRKIDTSDAILVVNNEKNGIEGYVGGNTLMEITYAYAHGLEVFLLNPVPDVNYRDEINGVHPIVLNGDIAAIDTYFSSLPALYVSSKSPVKRQALSRGLRRAGIRTRVIGLAVESGVNEQPMSVEESYDGARNRHEALTLAVPTNDATYLATIESGFHSLHKDHNVFGCSAVIIEHIGGERKVGIDVDIEFPRAMTDKVPSEYADLGVLVQQEYGSQLKDPYPFITNYKLTRARILENAVYNLAVQFS